MGHILEAFQVKANGVSVLVLNIEAAHLNPANTSEHTENLNHRYMVTNDSVLHRMFLLKNPLRIESESGGESCFSSCLYPQTISWERKEKKSLF